MSKFWSNLPSLAKDSAKWTTGVYAVFGFVAVFADLPNLFPENWHLCYRLLLGLGLLCALFVICLAILIACFCATNRVCILSLNGNHHVYVQYGDIFSPDVIVNKGEKRHIVINANRCFDTIVDDKLISSKTLHGRSMKMMYANHRYTEATLQEVINSELSGKKHGTLLAENKPEGNLKRYDLGTVVRVDNDELSDFFYLGMSSFDSRLQAHTSIEEYMVSIQRLLEFCNTYANGYPVVISLMGGGLARTGKEESVLLDYLVQTIKLNKDLITYDLHLVIYDKSKDVLPIAGLK